MAEKRKLPARDRREPAAKRRASEAISQSSSRRKASTPAIVAHAPTPVPEPEPQATPEPIEEPLPIKIKEGDSLPTRSHPQPSLSLSDKDYQSIAESAILSISLERSKKKWLSDGIFERYWTKPKKTKREQIEGKNPPKDSMTKIGTCKIIIEPHHFDGMIYTVKDPNAKPTVQIPPPQRHIVQYGPPPQPGYQYQHYAPPQQMRPPPYPYSQPPNPHHGPPQPRPPQPAPPVQRQPAGQPQRPPPQPAKPSPDPVIQMLATRAASNPELKALMRIVASSNASQEQLRIFQGHIDELNAIIRKREEQQRRQQRPQQQYHQHPQPLPQSQPPQNPQASSSPTNQNQPGLTAPSSSQQSIQDSPQPNSQQTQTAPLSSHTSTPALGPSSALSSAPSLAPANDAPKPQPLPPQSETPTTAQAGKSENTQTISTSSASQSEITESTIQTPSAIQIKTEPSTPVVLAPAYTPQTPAPSTNTLASTTSNVPSPIPAPPSTAIVSTPAAPRPTTTAPSPAPSHVPKASPVPASVSTNQSPQPLSPYPPGPPPYPQYQIPPYAHAPPPIKARSTPQYGPSTYYQSAPTPPPPKPPIKAVVFEFTSPLTPYGSSTSGHAGSGDRYLFPEYSILEYQSGGTVLLASFLLVRKVDCNTKFPLEQTPDIAPKSKSKSAKSKKKDKEKAAEIGGPSTPAGDNESQAAYESKEKSATGTSADADEKKQSGPSGDQEASSTKAEQSKKEDTANFKEYYQPITMRFYSSKPATLEPLSRIVKPPAEVCKYMEEVMERAERAPAGFLPFRLPRDKPLEADINDKASLGTAPTPAAVEDKTKTNDRSVTVATGEADEVIQGTGNDLETEDLEFLLKDYYDPPNGLVPIRA